MSASIAGDIVVVFNDKKEQVAIVSTYCPNQGVKFFFQHYPQFKKAEFQLWHRVWHCYNHDIEYTKKPIGTFTRDQVEAAGETPVAQVVDMPTSQVVVKAQERAAKQNEAGKTRYARSQELRDQGVGKQDAFTILAAEYKNDPPQKIKGMLHSVYAQKKA